MTPESIIRQAKADGVNLAPTPAGTLKATGDKEAIQRWTPLLRIHKAGILAALREAPIPDDLEDLIRQAGAFWEYSPEDYDLIRAVARRDPEGLRLALRDDPAFQSRRRTAA